MAASRRTTAPVESFATSGVTLPRVCAVVLLLLGLLPVANWIPGGHAADWYGVSASEWLNGSLISLGAAAVAFIVSRRFGLWPTGLTDRVSRAADARKLTTSIVLAVTGATLYALIARLVLSGKPLLIDELVQVMQARIFATGRLTLPAAPHPEFFTALHVVDFGGRSFSQFPPGGPAMLLPGVLVGMPWMVGPVFGALSAGVYWLVVRDAEPRRGVALGAALLFTFAPFTSFMAGSHMNHVPTLFWLCVAMFALQRIVRELRPSPAVALACGVSFGIAATIRPTDAAAFALPAAVWLLVRAYRVPGAWRDVAAAGAGVFLPVAMLLAYNAHTTGDPLLFGYELLWGKTHGLGFHRAPWGVAHTPARGLELVNLYFLRLQTYLFESSLPSLVPAILALALTRTIRGFDRYLLWSSSLLVAGYFAYWHDGFFLGPRFFYPLLPVLALWTARLPALVREHVPRLVHGDRFVLLTYLASACLAIAVSIPVRVKQYAGGLTSMRHDYLAPAASNRVRDAVILVRESWGAQLIVRLWALGVPHSETESLYRGVDSCVLEENIGRLEREGQRGQAAFMSLMPLLRDSAFVRKSEVSPDQTERVLPGYRYSVLCIRRIEEDRAGYTFLAPILAAGSGSNTYARDLHARDSLLLRGTGERPVYLLRPQSSALGAPLQLYRVSLDSARADWRAAGGN